MLNKVTKIAMISDPIRRPGVCLRVDVFIPARGWLRTNVSLWKAHELKNMKYETLVKKGYLEK